jgi:hypothetical protein
MHRWKNKEKTNLAGTYSHECKMTKGDNRGYIDARPERLQVKGIVEEDIR